MPCRPIIILLEQHAKGDLQQDLQQDGGVVFAGRGRGGGGGGRRADLHCPKPINYQFAKMLQQIV